MGLFLLNAVFIKPILAGLIYAAQIVFCNKLLKLIITPKTNYYKRYELGYKTAQEITNEELIVWLEARRETAVDPETA